MIELIEALERLLEKGIIVEPVVVGRIKTGALRIRLADEQPHRDPGVIPAEPQQQRGW